jgi:3-methyladenine DNA glycosylase/8-oxoguanine DNA glycosylase
MRRVELEGPYDLAGSTLVGDLGGRHPSLRKPAPGELLRATRCPGGAVTYHLRHRREAGTLEVEAWGPGREWLLDGVPELFGVRDRPERFSGKLGRLQARRPGVRQTRAASVFELLVHHVIRQRVAWRDAVRSHVGVIRAWGEPAPGPGDLLLPLSPAQWRGLSTYELAAHGLERKRARTILGLAARADRIAGWAATLEPEACAAKLELFPGVGPWTSGWVRALGLGDRDAVPTGDYELPSLVAWVLAGEARADDARMLELLEPYAGRRFRVIHLLHASGLHAPRFGPRKRANGPGSRR